MLYVLPPAVKNSPAQVLSSDFRDPSRSSMYIWSVWLGHPQKVKPHTIRVKSLAGKGPARSTFHIGLLFLGLKAWIFSEGSMWPSASLGKARSEGLCCYVLRGALLGSGQRAPELQPHVYDQPQHLSIPVPGQETRVSEPLST